MSLGVGVAVRVAQLMGHMGSWLPHCSTGLQREGDMQSRSSDMTSGYITSLLMINIGVVSADADSYRYI